MAITRKLIHFKNFSNFNTQKLSADKDNTTYTVGVGGSVVSGEPYILYHSIVFIKDVLKIWTHGSLYDCGETDLSAYLTADEIASVYATIEALNGKQDTISDLETIRSGAAKGATALQEIPAEYVTESELTAKGYATTSAMNTALGDKVDKVSGKGLSTNDFTAALKTKLEGLNNYDDTELSNAVSALQSRLDTLVSGDASTAIDSFNEIIAFLDGIEDSTDLNSIIASIEQQIAAKYTKPSTGIPKSDLASDVQTSLGKADTALQSYTEKYTGTITGITMNGASKGTSGVVDLGTVITAHQDISGKQDKVLKFENVVALNWVSDSTYSDFPYRCDMVCTGVTESMFGEVVFGITEASSGNYASLCKTGTNVVSIYSNVTTSITVLTIIVTP